MNLKEAPVSVAVNAFEVGGLTPDNVEKEPLAETVRESATIVTPISASSQTGRFRPPGIS